MSLPKHKMKIVVRMLEEMVSEQQVPVRILVLIKDLHVVAYRYRGKGVAVKDGVVKEGSERSFMTVMFHNKGMDMIGIPKILNNSRVMAALPEHLKGLLPRC